MSTPQVDASDKQQDESHSEAEIECDQYERPWLAKRKIRDLFIRHWLKLWLKRWSKNAALTSIVV